MFRTLFVHDCFCERVLASGFSVGATQGFSGKLSFADSIRLTGEYLAHRHCSAQPRIAGRGAALYYAGIFVIPRRN